MFIKLYNQNGVEITTPTPGRGVKFLGQQLVDSARTADGIVVAQKINRRLIKLDNLVWPYLTAAQWTTLTTAINGFYGWVEFYYPPTGTHKKMKFYWGDSSAEPFEIDPDTGDVISWVNCQCNIIDMGLPLEDV